MGENNKLWKLVLAALVVGLAGGYWFGDSRGYGRAQDDVKKLQEEAAAKAAGDAAKAANPFQAVNPLSGVEANPFEKAKNVLNPFK